MLKCILASVCVCVCRINVGDVIMGISICLHVYMCVSLLACLGICSLSAGCLGLMHTWRAT